MKTGIVMLKQLPTQEVVKFFSSLKDKMKFSSGQKKQTVEITRRIGLNIGRSSIIAAEMLHGGSELVLEKCYRKELTEGSVGQQLKTFLQEAGFQSKKVNLSLKGQGIVIRFLRFPRMNRSDFESALQFEAEKYLPFNLSDVMLDFHMNEKDNEPGKSGTTMPVILVAARKTEVQKLIQLAQFAGLEINAIDVDTLACSNAFELGMPEMIEKVVGVVDFGGRDTTFMIRDKGMLVFSRDIAFGGSDAIASIKRKLNITDGEAAQIQYSNDATKPEYQEAIQESLERVFHELKLSINYYFNQRENAPPIESLFISGGYSQTGMLPELLQKRLEIPVQKWDPTQRLKLDPSLKSELLKPLIPYLPVSIGLAIRLK